MLNTNDLKYQKVITTFLSYSNIEAYKPRQTIISEGEPSQHLYYVYSGSVKVLIRDQKKREILLTYLNTSDFFGELALFDETDTSRSAYVKAKTNCNIAKISYDELKKLYVIFPDLLMCIASQLVKRLKKTNARVGDLSFTNTKGRLAKTLIELSQEPDAQWHSDGKQIKITRQELSKLVGCSREMVGRMLKSLENDRNIRLSGRSIIIYDE